MWTKLDQALINSLASPIQKHQTFLILTKIQSLMVLLELLSYAHTLEKISQEKKKKQKHTVPLIIVIKSLKILDVL